MARAKSNPLAPFVGRWRITHMEAWEQDFVDAEVEGYFEFDRKGSGEFQFGYVSGGMDCRPGTRDGQPCVEWTWDGSDEMDPTQGRGWAVVKGDELHGLLVIHQGDESEFVAKRVVGPGRTKKG
jgi:hypothetical protein